MFIAANIVGNSVASILMSFAYLVHLICSVLYFLLVIRIVISWFRVDPYNDMVQMLYKITDPILAPLRRLPLRIGMMDFTPIVAFIALQFIDRLLSNLLQTIARSL